MLTYVDLHWGRTPTGEANVHCLSDAPVSIVGVMHKIVYASVKDHKGQVYQHELDSGDGTVVANDGQEYVFDGMPLVELDRQGAFLVPTVTAPLAALGRAIEFWMDDGSIIAPSRHWLCVESYARGRGRLVLASEEKTHFGFLERVKNRRRLPYVTSHGIEY